MADYTPPLGNDVDFTFTGSYTPPDGDDVDFSFEETDGGITTAVITIISVSRDTIYDDTLFPGFDETVVVWSSSIAGPYQIEVGGDAVNTGDVVVSGTVVNNIPMYTTITTDMIEACSSFSGAGQYQISIYVQNEDSEWNPQE